MDHNRKVNRNIEKESPGQFGQNVKRAGFCPVNPKRRLIPI
jgi:hypothetical protein